MEHEKYLDWISRNLDGDLDPQESKELADHLSECEACRTYQEDATAMTYALRQLPPLTLEQAVKEQVVAKSMGKNWVARHRRWLPYAAILLVAFILVVPMMSRWLGVGRQSEDNSSGGGKPGIVDGDYGNGTDGGTPPDKGEGGGGDTGGVTTLDDAFDPTKIIYTGSINLYTEDLKDTLDEVTQYITSIGGFVQQSGSDFTDRVEGQNARSGYLLLRIKSENFEATMKKLEEFGEVISSNVNTTNITQQYQDIKGELDSYLIQQERLLTYLQEAKSVTDMLTIEEQLTRVRSEINYRTTMIRNWDTQVAFSTIQVNLYQRTVAVSKVTNPFADFGIRIRDAFVRSINTLLTGISQLLLVLTALLPYLVIALAIALVVRWIWKKQKK